MPDNKYEGLYDDIDEYGNLLESSVQDSAVSTNNVQAAPMDDEFTGLYDDIDEFGHSTAPPPEPEIDDSDGAVSDKFKSLVKGSYDVGSMIGGLGEYVQRQAEQIGVPGAETLSKLYGALRSASNAKSEEVIATMSPGGQRDIQKKYATWGPDAAWKDIDSVLFTILGSAPATVVTMGPAGKAAQTAFAEVIKKGGSQLAAKKAAAKAAGTTGAVLEGSLGAGGIAADVSSTLEAMTTEDLEKMEGYQKVKDSHPGMSEDDLRKAFIASAERWTVVAGGLVTAAVGKAAGPLEAKVFTGGGGRLKAGATGAGTEAVQEGLQSPAETMATNIALEKPIMEDALESVIAGVVGGAGTGAGMGVALGGGEASDAGEPGPMADLEKGEANEQEIQRRMDQVKKMGSEEIAQYQEQVRQDIAAKGGDPLEQELGAAQAGVDAGSGLESEVTALNRLMAQRAAIDEEARYFDEQVKEDAAREKIQQEAAATYEQNLKDIEAERAASEERTRVAEVAESKLAEVQKTAVATEAEQTAVEKEAARKTRAAEKADQQLNKLRKRRQELGLEPKQDLEGTSPYPSKAEVEAFKGEKPTNQAMAEAMSAAANEAATSPTNDLPLPTAAQKTAGNYKKGHASFQGLPLTIENAAGSVREGDGWKQNMKDNYGYIKGTQSAEGKTEQLDVFVGEDMASQNVFLVDQVKEDGSFDEHKAMLAYPNEFAARKAYRRNYPKGFKVGEISTLTVAEFKEWLNSGDQTVPFKAPKKAPGKKGGVKKARSMMLKKGEKLTLHHYSQTAGIPELDPARHGTGKPGGELAVKKAKPKTWVDRTYFYMDADHTPEQGVGKQKYTVKMDPSKLYDLDADPAGIRDAATEGTIYDSNKADQLIKDAGFAGFRVNDPQLGNVAAVFEKTTPEEARTGNEYFAPSALKEKHVQISPEKFLELAERLRFPNEQKAADVAAVIDKFDDKWSSLPVLTVKDGKVTGHEGRHRAMDLIKRGVRSMPVRIIGESAENITSQDGKTTMPWPKGQEGRDFKDFFSSITKGLAGKSSTGKDYVPVISAVADKMAVPRSPTARFSMAYASYRGNFDDHIAFSIPGFKEVQVAVGSALSSVYGKGSNILDIGASEGSFAKAISQISGAKTVALDPNPDMRATFESMPIPGSKYAMEALGSKLEEGSPAWTEDDGTVINYFDPKGQKFDVIHEAMVFQFIAPDRQAQISRVKELLKADGVAIFEEKMFTEQQKANEVKKNEYKSQYFHKAEMTKKATEVLEGMDRNTVHQHTLEEVLTSNFGHVVQFWDSGNFKGYAVSDSAMKLGRVVSAIGETTSEFATTATPRRVEAPSSTRLKLDKVDNKTAKVDNKTAKVDKADADVAVAELNAKLPGLKANVMKTPYGLPSDLYQRGMDEHGMAFSQAQGLYDIPSGTIYLFSDNVSSVDELVTVALHEGVGHKGLRLMLADKLPGLLDDVAARGDMSKIKQIADKYGLDIQAKDELRAATEEYIAHVAEDNINAPILRQVLDVIRQVLRDLGVLSTWTEADIKALLRKTRSTLKGGRSLRRIRVQEYNELGDLEEVGQPVDVELRQLTKRISVLEKLRGCVS